MTDKFGLFQVEMVVRVYEKVIEQVKRLLEEGKPKTALEFLNDFTEGGTNK
ncbi:MAG: hypothetical protein GY799_29520 [Desulfobulbaceae bacterium]|nr:hypothetical protein [Desulfobulbaceae bacterium]